MTLFNPSRYNLAIFTLVCALHAGLIVWLSLSRPTPIRLPETPVMMISLAPPEAPVVEPPPPPPAPKVEPMPPLEPEPTPVVAVEKPSASKLAPVKPPVKPREPVKIKPKVKPKPVPVPPVATPKTAPPAPPSPVVSPRPTPPAEASPPPVIAARYDAAYLNNPAPAYPPLSRRLGESGKVLLRAQVLPSGKAGTVEIQRSSGSARLDAAAQKAIQSWRFVPARQGDNALASWVIIPIVFNLER